MLTRADAGARLSSAKALLWEERMIKPTRLSAITQGVKIPINMVLFETKNQWVLKKLLCSTHLEISHFLEKILNKKRSNLT